MHIEVVRSSELDAALRLEWTEALRARPASPLLTPQWADLCGTHRPTTRVLIIEQGPQRSYLAVDVDHGLVRPTGLGLNDLQAVVGSVEGRPSIQRLARALGANDVQLHRLDAPDALRGGRTRKRSCPIVDLSYGYGAYTDDLRRRGSRLAARVRQYTRQMERQLGDVRVEVNRDSPEAMATPASWKSAQFRSAGAEDAFSLDWVRGLVDDVCGRTDPALSGWSTVLYAGEQMLAAHLGVVGNGVAHWWLAGYDRRFASLGPGLVMATRCIEWLASRHVDVLDLGVGDDQYKLRQANRTEERWQVDWIRRSPATKVADAAHRLIRRTRRGLGAAR